MERICEIKHVINTGKETEKQAHNIGKEENGSILFPNSKEYLEQGVILRSKLPWISTPIMVKESDGSYRMCLNFKALNSITIPDRYPLPNKATLFIKLHGATIFSKLDAKSGYFQISMDEESIEKTAFGTTESIFAFFKMLVGLINSPATFQRYMDTILAFFIDKSVIFNLDDIIIFSKSNSEHEEHLAVVEKIKDIGMVKNDNK